MLFGIDRLHSVYGQLWIAGFAKSSLFVSNKLDGNVDEPSHYTSLRRLVRPSGRVLSEIAMLVRRVKPV